MTLLAGLVAAALALPSVQAATRGVKLYNWSDCIGDTILADFQQSSGMKAPYDLFDPNDRLKDPLLVSRSGYDPVVLSNNFLGKQIKAGAGQALDRRLLPGWNTPASTWFKTLQSHDLAIGNVRQAAGCDQDTVKGIEIACVTLQGGNNLWLGLLAIPMDAANVREGHSFIYYLLEPEVIVGVSESVGYANPNPEAVELMDEDMRYDEAIYPPQAVLDKLYISAELPSPVQRL